MHKPSACAECERLKSVNADLLAAARYCEDMLAQKVGNETLGERIGLMGGFYATTLLGNAIARATSHEAPVRG